MLTNEEPKYERIGEKKMKLIIEIPEELLKTRQYVDYFGCVTPRLVEVIESGTLLPKGHGRLIDGDYLYKKLVANKCPDSLVLQFVKDEPTIIEADEGEVDE